MQAQKDSSRLIAATNAPDNPEMDSIVEKIYEALCDDLNTPVALSHIFDAVKIVNSAKDRQISLNAKDIEKLNTVFTDILGGILGICDEENGDGHQGVVDSLMNMILQVRKKAKENKDWTTSDRIRDELKQSGILIKDTKEGTEWSFE